MILSSSFPKFKMISTQDEMLASQFPLGFLLSDWLRKSWAVIHSRLGQVKWFSNRRTVLMVSF